METLSRGEAHPAWEEMFVMGFSIAVFDCMIMHGCVSGNAAACIWLGADQKWAHELQGISLGLVKFL